MSKKSFLTVADGSTVVFDADLAKNFQVTLAGNRSLTIAGGQEGDEIGILLIQDGTGSRTVTWGSNVSFAAGQAPSLTTAAAGTDLITLVKRGSIWKDTSGAPSKFPARITAASLATIALVGSGSGMKYIFSGGNGENAGGSSQSIEVRVNSGSQLNAKINASGSYLTGSGVSVVGAVVERPAQTKGSVVQKVVPGNKVANGTGTLIVNGAKGGAVCYADTDGTGYTKCDANNGTVACKVATALECL